jgi:hypothetical protein
VQVNAKGVRLLKVRVDEGYQPFVGIGSVTVDAQY